MGELVEQATHLKNIWSGFFLPSMELGTIWAMGICYSFLPERRGPTSGLTVYSLTEQPKAHTLCASLSDKALTVEKMVG